MFQFQDYALAAECPTMRIGAVHKGSGASAADRVKCKEGQTVSPSACVQYELIKNSPLLYMT